MNKEKSYGQIAWEATKEATCKDWSSVGPLSKGDFETIADAVISEYKRRNEIASLQEANEAIGMPDELMSLEDIDAITKLCPVEGVGPVTAFQRRRIHNLAKTAREAHEYRAALERAEVLLKEMDVAAQVWCDKWQVAEEQNGKLREELRVTNIRLHDVSVLCAEREEQLRTVYEGM